MLNDDKIIRMILGFKLKYLRQQKSLSYQELATLTGLSTSYLNDIEKGKRYPKPNKISILGTALGVDYNYLVSLNASKKLQPIVDLLSSKFFKLFPLTDFGISPEKLIELFTQTPVKVNAFISTIFKIARNYQVDETTFYKEALRSYQDMHNNYFPELENAAENFKQEFSIKGTLPYTKEFLEDQLLELYDIKVNRKAIGKKEELTNIRSYYDTSEKVLFLPKQLSEAQQNFLLARELGFHYLGLQERPFETTIIKIDTFEILLNNYKASHFAAALLMSAQELVVDIKKLTRENNWHAAPFEKLLKKYNVTPEMMLQRMTNILPHYFDLEDLFFIRLDGNNKSDQFKMTKDLHLSQLHSPYNNELNEHYCNRWVSITTIKDLKKSKSKKTHLIDAQISKYWNSDKEYFCISIAKPKHQSAKKISSVTLGLLITPQLKGVLNFISDPKLKYREVHTTCERCGIADCESRVAKPSFIQAQKKQNKLIESLNLLKLD